MKELISARKIKISLSDYDYETDIKNRLLMSTFSNVDKEILEEILYSSVKIPIDAISENLNIKKETLKESLSKLSKTGLFEFKEDLIIVNKQMRKYYEFQIYKFDDNFRPDLDFLQRLLKKIPIHVLPSWYSIPRTSNNIFESLIEKYLYTPHHFERHIEEQEQDEIIKKIIQDVFTSKDQKVSAKDLKDKYELSDIEFEKHMLVLEYSFALCLTYSKVNGFWEEMVTPFYEWRKYIKFISDTTAPTIVNTKEIKQKIGCNFSYISHMEIVLENIINIKPLFDDNSSIMVSSKAVEDICEKLNDYNKNTEASKEYISEVFERLTSLTFIKIEKNKISLTPKGKEWIAFSQEKKALAIYQNPSTHLSHNKYPKEIFTASNIRRAEKCILRILNSSWIYFDDFIEGVMIPIEDEQFIILKKEGRKWEYALPKYTEDQKNLISVVVLKWLHESAIIEIGTHNDKKCIRVSKFGKNIFEI